MLRLTLKNLMANRVRFAMTLGAVILAVSFVVSSFVLTDGLRDSFNDLSSDIVAGTDLEVRPDFESSSVRAPDADDLRTVAAVPGVAAAEARIEGDDNEVIVVKPDGELISINGPPQLAFAWMADQALSQFQLVEGSAPTAGSFTMDLDAAAKHGFVVGETYQVASPKRTVELTLSGLVSFGSNNDTIGATLMQFDPAELSTMIDYEDYRGIAIALDDEADLATVQGAIQTAVGSGLETVDNATLDAEQKADFNSNVDIISNVLLGFSAVTLFVSIFIIYNTFSIVLSQRTRELALLRTVGADPKQLRRSVLGEAAVVGVIASIGGTIAGVFVALGLRRVFEALGASLPDAAIVVSTRTMVLAAVVGVGATLVSAFGPTRKASRVPAIAALRDGADADENGSTKRIVAGVALLLAGIVAGGLGLAGGSTSTVITLLGLGAAGVFIGVTLLSPLFAEGLTRLLGWPMRKVFRVPGHLAQQNAGRNPRRTSTTAAALMIGLAMVSMALVVGQSLKAQLRSTLEEGVQADYLVTETTENRFPDGLTDELRNLPEVSALTGFSYVDFDVDGVSSEWAATDLEPADELFNLGIESGLAYDASVASPVLVSDDEAAAKNIAVGDSVPFVTADGGSTDLQVIGIYTDDVIVEEEYLTDRSVLVAAGYEATTDWVALSIGDDVTPEQAVAAFETLGQNYPTAAIDTFSEYVQQLEGFIDQALAALNVLVALAVIIALIGIANALALSVFERTRELGLLRAVGMTRRQVRSMVRFEAGLVALFGATLGVVTGIAFGWAAVVALPDEFTSTLAVPFGRIAILVLVSSLAGLLAAWGPARRAGKLPVLEAIAS